MFIRECMTKNPVTIEPGDTLARADAKMKAGGFRRLPVVQNGELIGILSEYDLRRYLDSLVLDSGCSGDDARPCYCFTFGNARTRSSRAQGKGDWRPARGRARKAGRHRHGKQSVVP